MILQVPGDEGHGLRVIAMGQRKSGIGGATRCSSDTGNDLEGYAGGGEGFKFFATASENERVAALEANDGKALARQIDQQFVDRFLGQRVLGGFLAGIDAAGIRARQIHDAIADQVVENQHIGPGDQTRSLDRQQVGVAGAGTDQPDFAGFQSVVCFHGANCSLGRTS